MKKKTNFSLKNVVTSSVKETYPLAQNFAIFYTPKRDLKKPCPLVYLQIPIWVI